MIKHDKLTGELLQISNSVFLIHANKKLSN